MVLWEIFSLGVSPYSGLKNAEVLEYIANGYRLQKPTNCPEFLYVSNVHCPPQIDRSIHVPMLYS